LVLGKKVFFWGVNGGQGFEEEKNWVLECPSDGGHGRKNSAILDRLEIAIREIHEELGRYRERARRDGKGEA